MLKKIISLSMILIMSFSTIAFADTPLDAEKQDYENNVNNLIDNIPKLPALTLPEISQNDLPSGYNNTNINDLFHNTFGSIDQQTPSITNNIPPSSYFNTAVNEIKNEQAVVDQKSQEGNVNINNLASQPLQYVNPFGINIDQWIASKQSQISTPEEIKNNIYNQTPPSGYKTVNINENLFGTTPIDPQFDNYVMQQIGNIESNTNSSSSGSTSTTAPSTGTTTQAMNGVLGSFLNPDGGVALQASSDLSKYFYLQLEKKNGTLTNPQDIQEYNTLQNDFSISKAIDTLKSLGNFILTGKK